MSHLTEPRFELARLTPERVSDLASFDCSDEEMNRFLVEEALDEQDKGLNNTFLLYHEGKVIAFYSICADSIRLKPDEKQQEGVTRAKVPAIKLARIGRDVRHRGKRVGQMLIEYVLHVAFTFNQKSLGVRFVTVDAYENRVPLYEKLGFVRNEAVKKTSRLVSMRADIFPD